jgi:ADP-heptose:LPS heptosyltransferase
MAQPLPEKLLVVRLGAIGDVVNALVFATAVKDASPRTHIGWAVHPLARPLVDDHPSVDRVHVWPRGAGVSGFRALVREVRAEGYGLAVDLQRLAKSAALARLSGAPRVLGYDRARAKELSWLLTRERIAPGHARAHMVSQYLEFAAHLGLPAAARHVLPADPVADAWAAARVAAWGTAPLVVHVGASKPENRWAPERHGELAAALADEHGGPVVLTGGPADRPDAARARAACPAAHDLAGATDLRQLAALCARARLFVGCDTGPMHLAAAAGCPVVALFGPADPLRTGPFGARARVVREPPAGADRGAPLPAASMLDVSVAAALRAARELLES